MTDAPVFDPKLSQRYHEAAHWLVRVNGPEAPEEDIEGWLRWCESDPENLDAFERLLQDWHDTEALKSAPELLVRLANRRLTPTTALGPGSARPNRGRRRWIRLGVAAALAGIALTGYMLLDHSPLKPAVVAATTPSPAELPDGSSLLLSAKATADVDFTGHTRDIALRPGGEAFVKVRHDKSRPFVVHAGTVTVTAVGTAFDVRRDAERVTVTVEEGTIVVAGPGPDGPTEWRASAGYQVEYSETAHTAAVSRVNPEAVLRWREGELAYDGEPLGTVIADINRYSKVTVTLDPALAALPYTGTVFVGSIDDWLKALQSKYPVRTDVSPGGVIELVAAGRPTGVRAATN